MFPDGDDVRSGHVLNYSYMFKPKRSEKIINLMATGQAIQVKSLKTSEIHENEVKKLVTWFMFGPLERSKLEFHLHVMNFLLKSGKIRFSRFRDIQFSTFLDHITFCPWILAFTYATTRSLH